jgi:hypothetical protein
MLLQPLADPCFSNLPTHKKTGSPLMVSFFAATLSSGKRLMMIASLHVSFCS